VPYPTTATLDTTDLSVSPGESRSVVSVQQSSATDVALAKLSAPVTDVTPLAIGHARPSLGSVVTLAGWGATSDVNPVPSTTLNIGRMKIKTVKTSYVYVVGYSPSTNTSACLYDSDAPYCHHPGLLRAATGVCREQRPPTVHTPAPRRQHAPTTSPTGSPSSYPTCPEAGDGKRRSWPVSPTERATRLPHVECDMLGV